MTIVLGIALGVLLFGCASPQPLPRIDPTDGRCTRRADTPIVDLPCTLSLLTYNVHGISNWMILNENRGDQRFRSASLGWLARDYDLVLLQEDFEYHDRITEGPTVAFVQRGTGPRWTLWPLKALTLPFWPLRFSAPYGSGLTITAPALQPVKIKEEGEVKRTDGVIVREALKACNGWITDANDCFSTKGVLGMRLLLRNGAEIDVYTTHLDAGGSADDRKARRKQLEQIRKKIEKKSKGRALIFAGDLNLEYDALPGTAINPDLALLRSELIEPLGLTDVGVRQTGKHFGHRVDWVLYRGTPAVNLQVLKYGEDERFRHPFNRGLVDEKPDYFEGMLSDHPALGVCFLVEKVPPGGPAPTVVASRQPRADSLDALHLCRHPAI